jgi:hypothetical protein
LYVFAYRLGLKVCVGQDLTTASGELLAIYMSVQSAVVSDHALRLGVLKNHTKENNGRHYLRGLSPILCIQVTPADISSAAGQLNPPLA